MTVRLEIIPEEPTANDAIQIFVHGQVDEPAIVKVTNDEGTLLKVARSTVFTQGVMPDGTGPDTFEVEVTGDPGDEIVFEVYQWGDEDGPYEADPVYYFEDEETYQYPESDEIIGALEAALPDELVGITVDRSQAPLLVVQFDGQLSGNRYILSAGDGVTVTAVPTPSGPYQWGPLVLPAGDYVVDVLLAEDEEESILDGDPVEMTVS